MTAALVNSTLRQRAVRSIPTSGRTLGHCAVGCSAVATVAGIAAGPAAGAADLVLMALAVVAFGATLHIERHTPFLTAPLVVSVALATTAAAVLLPPRGSADLWSYAMYGRIVVHHGASPYIHRPSEYLTDPLLRFVAPGWRHARSVYGPVFIGLAAAVSAVAGSSPLANRIGFQLLAATATLGAMFLLLRRRDAAAAAVVGLNPVVAASIVNGGHNDALVGLVALGGMLAIGRSRGAVAGVLFGLGALIKIVVVIPMAAGAVWAWRHDRRRSAASSTAIAAGMTALGYAVVGGRAALDPLLAAAARVSRATLWQLGGAHGSVLVNPRMTMAVVAGAVALALYLRARDQDPSAAVGAALVAYLLTAPYVLPWYAGWALPVLATTWRTRLSRVGLTHAALLLVVYVDAPGLDPDALHNAMRIISGVTLPVLEGVAVIGLVAAACRPQLLAHVRTGSHSAHTVVKR